MLFGAVLRSFKAKALEFVSFVCCIVSHSLWAARGGVYCVDTKAGEFTNLNLSHTTQTTPPSPPGMRDSYQIDFIHFRPLKLSWVISQIQFGNCSLLPGALLSPTKHTSTSHVTSWRWLHCWFKSSQRTQHTLTDKINFSLFANEDAILILRLLLWCNVNG